MEFIKRRFAMSLELIITALGSGGIVALISAYLTKKVQIEHLT